MDTHVIMYVVIRFVYDYYVMQLWMHLPTQDDELLSLKCPS